MNIGRIGRQITREDSIETPSFNMTKRANPFFSSLDHKGLQDQQYADSPKFLSQKSNESKSLSYQQSTKHLESSQNSFNPEKNSITVKLNLGQLGSKQIKCYINDDPVMIASKVVNENNLAHEAIPLIVSIIQKQIDSLVQQKKLQNPNENQNEPKFSFAQSHPPAEVKNILNDKKTSVRIQNGDPSNNENKMKQDVNHPLCSNSSKPKVIAKMNVNISPTETRELILFKGQDPIQVAEQFCLENGLPNELVQPLVQNLTKLIETYKNRNAKKQDAPSSQSSSKSQATKDEKEIEKESIQSVKSLNSSEKSPATKTMKRARTQATDNESSRERESNSPKLYQSEIISSKRNNSSSKERSHNSLESSQKNMPKKEEDAKSKKNSNVDKMKNEPTEETRSNPVLDMIRKGIAAKKAAGKMANRSVSRSEERQSSTNTTLEITQSMQKEQKNDKQEVKPNIILDEVKVPEKVEQQNDITKVENKPLPSKQDSRSPSPTSPRKNEAKNTPSPQKKQPSPQKKPLSPPTTSKDDNKDDKAERYEKWTNLLNAKAKIKQIETSKRKSLKICHNITRK
jgi:hypothetical protein